MRTIKYFVDALDEEIEGAKEYAEKYIECKAKENMNTASRFKEMSYDELKHASYIHEMAVSEIEKINKVFKPPESMIEKWEKAHKQYVEKAAWVRQMLEM